MLKIAGKTIAYSFHSFLKHYYRLQMIWVFFCLGHVKKQKNFALGEKLFSNLAFQHKKGPATPVKYKVIKEQGIKQVLLYKAFNC
jgi:hypothetical protein